MDIRVVTTNSDNDDFINLMKLLNEEFYEMFGAVVKQCEEFNRIEDTHDVIVLYDGIKPIACGSFKQFSNDTAEIKRVFVQKEYRQKGLATKIMRQLEKDAVSQGFIYVIIETGVELKPAVKLYRSLGYTNISQIQQRVFDKLNRMGINYRVLSHQAVHTIEEIDNLHINNGGEVVKNLFLCDDEKKRYFLVVLQKDKKADLKELCAKLNTRPLSFASEENLHDYMGLNKGSVTPFGVLNDTSCIVEVVFDHALLSFQNIGVHPNENTATLWLHLKDLEKVIKEHGNKISHIEI